MTLLLIGLAFTAAVLYLHWFADGWWLIVYGVIIPLAPFLGLAGAALSPRFPRFHLYMLAAFFIGIVGGPALFMYINVLRHAPGGANIGLGFYYLALPFAAPLALILGLALAAETARVRPNDRRA